VSVPPATTYRAASSDWLSFYMFTTFTDRDAKYQLLAQAEGGFDPLSRTTCFMLTEEAHHMFVSVNPACGAWWAEL
jgi:1,2-phenylacetyl-CoA epoxidase catalytic subunit